jgi:DNA replication protein DnaC
MNTATMEKMRELRLHGMLRAFRDSIEQRTSAGLSVDELIAFLIDAEWDERYNRTLSRLVKNAGFRYRGRVEEVDCSQGRNIDRNMLMRLASCDWIGKGENIIITGATGSGKSFLSCALGHAACVRSLKVKYVNCMKLSSHLKIARADGSYPREIKLLAKQDLVVLDDFGLKPLDADSRLFLFELLEDRYGIKSTIISSQVPVAKWFDIIGDPSLADAICDRVVHNAHALNLKGCSMRKKQANYSGQNLPPCE